MPKTIGQMASKQYSNIGKPYEGLAKVFKLGIKEGENVQRLVEEARVGSQFWDAVSFCLPMHTCGAFQGADSARTITLA